MTQSPQPKVDQRIVQGLEWLDKEIKKDQRENDLEKERMIKEIKGINRAVMVASKKKKKGFFKKLLMTFGYG